MVGSFPIVTTCRVWYPASGSPLRSSPNALPSRSRLHGVRSKSPKLLVGLERLFESFGCQAKHACQDVPATAPDPLHGLPQGCLNLLNGHVTLFAGQRYGMDFPPRLIPSLQTPITYYIWFNTPTIYNIKCGNDDFLQLRKFPAYHRPSGSQRVCPASGCPVMQDEPKPGFERAVPSHQ